MCCHLSQCVAVCHSVLQRIAVINGTLWVVKTAIYHSFLLLLWENEVLCVLKCVATCHSVSQCVTVCCSVLQCAEWYCHLLQCVAEREVRSKAIPWPLAIPKENICIYVLYMCMIWCVCYLCMRIDVYDICVWCICVIYICVIYMCVWYIGYACTIYPPDPISHVCSLTGT